MHLNLDNRTVSRDALARGHDCHPVYMCVCIHGELGLRACVLSWAAESEPYYVICACSFGSYSVVYKHWEVEGIIILRFGHVLVC